MDAETVELVIVCIIAPVVMWGLKEASAWLRAKATTERQRALVDAAQDAAEIGVNYAHQMVVSKIKSNGSLYAAEFTAEDKARAIEAALKAAAKFAPAVGLDQLEAAIEAELGRRISHL